MTLNQGHCSQAPVSTPGRDCPWDFKGFHFLICSLVWFLPVFKLEVNWAEGNGDAEILFRLGANIERCDRAVLEICGLLCVCVFFFKRLVQNLIVSLYPCLRDTVRQKQLSIPFRSLDSSDPSSPFPPLLLHHHLLFPPCLCFHTSLPFHSWTLGGSVVNSKGIHKSNS